MRKNFTQLFLSLMMVIGFSTMSYSQCDIPPPEGAIYNFQFDGGPEGWRSLDAAGFETTAGWGWSETGTLKQGFFSTNYPDVIDSESQCNGAMVMDSDFLDNAGLGPDGFGTGDCPADCNAYLVSPVMDLSSTQAVELIFTQSVRQFQSEYFVYVSIDGGATNVDTIEINDDLVTNAAVSSRTFNLPLCSAGGEANVVITFHINANYYVWAIDDVTLLEASTDVDMRVNRNFYTKVTNYMTPKNMGSTVPILADIENLKAFPNAESTLRYRVRDAVNAELFTAERVYGEVPGCSTDENKLFDATYTMPDEEGEYTVEFEMDAEGDINPDNDIITAPFVISEREFRKVPTQEAFGSEYLTGVRYGDGFLSWGAYFHIPQNEGGQAIESVSLGIISNAGVTPSTGVINVGVYQWIDFDDIGTVNPGERVLLGEVDILVEPNSPEFQQWTVTPLDPNGELIVPEPGAELLVMGHTNPFDGVTNYFFNCAQETGFEEFSAGANNLAHREAGLIGGYGSFASINAASHDDRHTDREFFNIDGAYAYDIAVMMTPATSIEEINPNLGVRVFPSPANTTVSVDLDLEEVSEKVSIELTDMAGNRAGIYNYNNVKKDRFSIDVSQMPVGMYLMNVRTSEGMISRKISIVH